MIIGDRRVKGKLLRWRVSESPCKVLHVCITRPTHAKIKIVNLAEAKRSTAERRADVLSTGFDHFILHLKMLTAEITACK